MNEISMFNWTVQNVKNAYEKNLHSLLIVSKIASHALK